MMRATTKNYFCLKISMVYFKDLGELPRGLCRLYIQQYVIENPNKTVDIGYICMIFKPLF